MPRVVIVGFRRAGRSYQFDAGHLDLRPGDVVVARTARGLELGTVRSAPVEIPEPPRSPRVQESKDDNQLLDSSSPSAAEGSTPSDRAESRPRLLDLKPVVRKATEEDLRRDAENAAREREAMDVAAEKIADHGLEMKLIEAEATLDGSRMVLHFSAEGRVDFRALVRDLAKALHTRVELHQVGVRDEAKMRGGLGHCGRPLCCATFLTDFDPVGIKMAKEQELSLNPQKISGMCGRLMCCLAFEYDFYHQARACVPKIGARVETEQGPGRITEINAVRGRVVVELEEGGRIALAAAALERHKPGCPHTCPQPASPASPAEPPALFTLSAAEGSAAEGSAAEGEATFRAEATEPTEPAEQDR
jgi:cell fate regulator YaaT (PSP1 superfamily)